MFQVGASAAEVTAGCVVCSAGGRKGVLDDGVASLGG